MANDFITINQADTNAIFAADLKRATVLTRDLMNLLQSLIDHGFRLFDNGDFSGFETKCGLPTGKGQTVFDLLNGTQGALLGAMQNANAVELKNRVG